MEQRLNAWAASPELYRALSGVERHLRKNVDETLLNLVKLRASMTNGCAFCIDLHTTHAIEAGERLERLFGVAAWREAPWYSPTERAALALTDAMTELGEHGVPDDVWDDAAACFDERELVDLLGAIAMINLWNRIAVASRATPTSATTAPAVAS